MAVFGRFCFNLLIINYNLTPGLFTENNGSAVVWVAWPRSGRVYKQKIPAKGRDLYQKKN